MAIVDSMVSGNSINLASSPGYSQIFNINFRKKSKSRES